MKKQNTAISDQDKKIEVMVRFQKISFRYIYLATISLKWGQNTGGYIVGINHFAPYSLWLWLADVTK